MTSQQGDTDGDLLTLIVFTQNMWHLVECKYRTMVDLSQSISLDDNLEKWQICFLLGLHIELDFNKY